MQSHPEFDLVSSGVEVFDGEKTVGYIVRKELPDKFDAVKHSCFSHATIMTHKYVYDRLKGYSLSPRVVRVEDYDLWCRFFEAGFKGINIPDVLYTVLEDDVTLSRRKMGASINAALTALKYIKRFKLPFRYVIYPARRIATSLVPKPIYKRIHNNRLKNGHRY